MCINEIINFINWADWTLVTAILTLIVAFFTLIIAKNSQILLID
ncbi:hypothetical protein [Methanobrevibacter arboriphilus]|nr:hypothetical protein [Methanobrevibacter arboriphilus]